MATRENIENEKFYTKKETAKKLSNMVKSMDFFKNIKTIIEPSAGNGSFSINFNDNDSYKCHSFDILPEENEKVNIEKLDYLETNILEKLNNKPSETLVIGNPPFGRQSTTALKFIKKCMIEADYIAFILPISFYKDSLKNKVPLTHSILYEEVLDKNSFVLPNENEYDVKCIFQVWYKKERVKTEKIEIDGITFTTKKNAEYAFRRVGSKAGILISDYEEISLTNKECFYYMIISDKKIVEIIKNYDWDIISQYSVGPKSIGKQDFLNIIKYNINIL